MSIHIYTYTIHKSFHKSACLCTCLTWVDAADAAVARIKDEDVAIYISEKVLRLVKDRLSADLLVELCVDMFVDMCADMSAGMDICADICVVGRHVRRYLSMCADCETCVQTYVQKSA